jgi:hypothetical protein
VAQRKSDMKRKARLHVRFVARVERWLRAAGVAKGAATEAAIDLADGLHAADQVRQHLRNMLRADPRTKRGADAASREAIHLHVWADGELRFHINRLLRRWEPNVIDVIGSKF